MTIMEPLIDQRGHFVSKPSRLLESKATTDSWKLKVYMTLMHMMKVVDLDRIRTEDSRQSATSMKDLQDLHQQSELIPALRRLLDHGFMTLTDFESLS